MSVPKQISELFQPVGKASTLADVAATLRRLSRIVGADSYLLLDTPQEHSTLSNRIVASDWPRDVIEIVGLDALVQLGAMDMAGKTGTQELRSRRIGLAELDIRLGPDLARDLADFGFADFMTAWISAGLSRGLVIFAARGPGSLDLDQMPRARMLCCYLWSTLNCCGQRAAPAGPLSERERECLSWVSEGKTTDEVAMILDVSANTVNRYILHATQKLSAANRAMAIAIATRNGLI